MKKYTVEQLSRILSVAAVGGLGRYTCTNIYKHFSVRKTMCIEQAAAGTFEPGLGGLLDIDRGRLWDGIADVGLSPRLPDDVLDWIETNGMA